MQFVAILLLTTGVLITPFYFHALFRFWRILVEERPELVDQRGALSFFYSGLPRITDPNVGTAVIRAAFSPVAQELHHADAVRYAQCVRLGLLVGVPAYLVAFAILLAGAP